MVNDKPILIVMAGDTKIDNPKYKLEFNTKACMIERDKVEELIGHGVGGVCPFGINPGVDVYLDESLKDLKQFFRLVVVPKVLLNLQYQKWKSILIILNGLM